MLCSLKIILRKECPELTEIGQKSSHDHWQVWLNLLDKIKISLCAILGFRRPCSAPRSIILLVVINHFSHAYLKNKSVLPCCSYLDGCCFITGLSCSCFLTQHLIHWNHMTFRVLLEVFWISICCFFFCYYSTELENWSSFTFLTRTQMEERYFPMAPGTKWSMPLKTRTNKMQSRIRFSVF